MAGWLRMFRPRLPAAETETTFHPTRGWRFDFCWPDYKVALEVEGASWSAGRHVRGGGFEEDCVKYCEAAVLGWIVLRVTRAMIDDGRAADLVYRTLLGVQDRAVNLGFPLHG